MQRTAREVLPASSTPNDPLLDVALELEPRRFVSTNMSVKRRLFPNIDFYSGMILKINWAFPRPCSPRCSRWRARLDGSPSGRK